MTALDLHSRTTSFNYWLILALLPRRCSGNKSSWQCRGCRFNPLVRRIPWSRKWQPAPLFLPGEVHGQRSCSIAYSPGRSQSWTWLRTEQHHPMPLEKKFVKWTHIQEKCHHLLENEVKIQYLVLKRLAQAQKWNIMCDLLGWRHIFELVKRTSPKADWLKRTMCEPRNSLKASEEWPGSGRKTDGIVSWWFPGRHSPPTGPMVSIL